MNSRPLNILMTGSTRIQTGYGNRMEYLDTHSLLYHTWKNAGHNVDLRAVVPGEDLSGYDRIIVGIWPFASRTGGFCYGALWAYSYRDRIPVGATINDWLAQGALNNYQSIARKPRNDWFGGLVHDYREEAEAVSDTLYDTICGLAKEFVPIIGSFFDWPWADSRKTWNDVPNPPHVKWDPTRMTPRYVDDGGVAPEARERAWILAALYDHENFVNRLRPFEWPLKQFGVRKYKQPRVMEDRVVELYSQHWGTLVPTYGRQMGNGAWRPRIPFALYAGAMIYMDPKEFGVKVGGHIFSPYIPKLEKLSTDGLANFQRKQLALMEEHAWPLEMALEVPEVYIQDLQPTMVK